MTGIKHNAFNALILEHRLKHGLSQVQLAKSLKIRSQFVSNWERGASNPPYSMIPKILHLLKISKKKAMTTMISDYSTQLEKTLK